MVGPRDDLARENRMAIERYGGVTVVGELPSLDPLTPEVASASGPIDLSRSATAV